MVTLINFNIYNNVLYIILKYLMLHLKLINFIFMHNVPYAKLLQDWNFEYEYVFLHDNFLGV